MKQPGAVALALNTFSCCKMEHFRTLPYDVILHLRNRFWTAQKSVQDTRLFDFVANNRIPDEMNQEEYRGAVWLLEGHVLCASAVAKAFGIGPRRFKKVKAALKKNQPVDSVEGRTAANAQRSNKLDAVCTRLKLWLQDYILVMAEFMPHLSEVHLPLYRVREVWIEFDAHCVANGQDGCSYGWFTRVFRGKDFKHVKIYKHKPFSKCDECSNLDSAMTACRAGKPGPSLEAIMAEKSKHSEAHMLERDAYNKRCKLSVEEPKKYTQLDGDGFSDWKTEAPKFNRVPKEMDKLIFPKYGVYGCLIHREREQVMVFTAGDRIKHGGNYCAEMLLRSLLSLPDKWTPTLYVQADNTAKDIRNNTVLPLCFWMVGQKIFKEVRPSCYICKIHGISFFGLVLLGGSHSWPAWRYCCCCQC